jgi:hypothetical protein
MSRREHDYYPTPPHAVRALLTACPRLPTMGLVLEPAVGDAAILRAIESARPHERRAWVTCDIRDVSTLHWTDPRSQVETARRHVHGDFLAMGESDLAPMLGAAPPTLIITNPPFSHTLPFAAKCLEIAAGCSWTALLLPLGFLESDGRAAFLTRHPPDIYVFATRPRFIGTGTDSTGCAWYVWPPVGSRAYGRAHGRIYPPIIRDAAQAELPLGCAS